MANPQLLTTRRNYNRWVANQTLEDFALRSRLKMRAAGRQPGCLTQR